MPILLQGFEVSITLRGNGKAERTKVFEIEKDAGAIDDDAAFVAGRTAASEIVSGYQLLSGAAVVSWSLRGIYEETGALSINAALNVYDEAFLTVGLNASGSDKGNLSIMQPLPAIFVGDDVATGVIDIADASLVAFMALFESPKFGRISDGQQVLGGILKQKVRSVGSGKTY